MAGQLNSKSTVSSKNNNLEQKGRGKALWDPKVTKIFIDLCKADVLARIKLGTRLRNPVWKLLTPTLNELAESEFDQHQLKNKWDNLRRDWLLWRMVTDGAANKGFSPKDDVCADDECWEARLKAVPKAAKFQKRPPEHLDDLEIIFSHTVSNGESSRAPPSSGIIPKKEYLVTENYPRPLEGNGSIKVENDGTGVEDPSRVFGYQLLTDERNSAKDFNVSKRNEHQSMEGNEKAGGDIGLENFTPESPASAKTAGDNDGKKKKLRSAGHRESNSEETKRARIVRGEGTFSNEPDRNRGAAGSVSSAKSSATSTMTRRTGSSSIAEVMEVMDGMPDVEPAGELYMLGTRLFMKRENREMFMALRTPRVRMAWLRQELGRECQNKRSSS